MGSETDLQRLVGQQQQQKQRKRGWERLLSMSMSIKSGEKRLRADVQEHADDAKNDKDKRSLILGYC